MTDCFVSVVLLEQDCKGYVVIEVTTPFSGGGRHIPAVAKSGCPAFDSWGSVFE